MERPKSTADEAVAWRLGRVCWERAVVQEDEAGEHGGVPAKGFWGATERVPAKSRHPFCMLARLLWPQWEDWNRADSRRGCPLQAALGTQEGPGRGARDREPMTWAETRLALRLGEPRCGFSATSRRPALGLLPLGGGGSSCRYKSIPVLLTSGDVQGVT